ncbi:uncharacterized protein BDZ99DRAFT_468786 [Mytilinidion resinicola]|uniref:Acyl-CoA N-acyltransferase n=1 Tax=Mytilinidion resinicola TaxID=574789 RepID=A0A6A6Y212_9PEZI|nr:uncharacterized protein BDZ99DRAFT_468786 [Mytilinidion resinicola]KAF2802553.1 hypothetical protein BDZ99DRAFT_468786 [Mytilinidion resinicola]
MKVRPAIASDIPHLAAITVRSLNEDAMDEYLYPGRHKHPVAYQAAYEKRNKNLIEWPSVRIMVAMTEPSDDKWSGAPEISGFCIWNRNGESKEVKEKWWPKQTLKQRMSLWMRDTYIAQAVEAIQNPSMSVVRYFTYGSKDEEYFDPKDKDPDDFWGVIEILVDQSFQRRGVGQLLLKWGFEQARVEQIPVSLAATKAGEALYFKVGMRHVGKWKWGPKPEMESKLFRWDPPKGDEATINAPATEAPATDVSTLDAPAT